MMIVVGSKVKRTDPIFDGTKNSAMKLLKKVFPSLSKYSLEELSNTNVGGLWEDNKNSRVWIVVSSITALQVMRLAYLFQTTTDNVLLAPDFNASPNCDKCWWNIRIMKSNSTIWKWKP